MEAADDQMPISAAAMEALRHNLYFRTTHSGDGV
jgi:hypothetical protein